MGYFEAVANNHFKSLEDGTRIFYPQGAMGRVGYIVPDSKLESVLRASLKRFYIWLIVGTGIFGGLGGPLISKIGFVELILVAGFLGWLIIRLYFMRITRDLEKVRVANSMFSCWASMGESMSWVMLIVFTSFFLLSSIASLLLYQSMPDIKLLAIGIFFALCLIPYGIAILHKIRNYQ